jgi:hypothetical protein
MLHKRGDEKKVRICFLKSVCKKEAIINAIIQTERMTLEKDSEIIIPMMQ